MTKPLVPQHLTALIVEVVESSPGSTSNAIARAVRARKMDVLAELHRLAGAGQLRSEPGKRASKCWHLPASPGNRFPLACEGPGADPDVPAESFGT